MSIQREQVTIKEDDMKIRQLMKKRLQNQSRNKLGMDLKCPN